MELKRAVLSFKETYAQAMAVTAPLGSVVSTTTAAILYAGSSGYIHHVFILNNKCLMDLYLVDVY
ncbi:Hypothetical protein SSO12142 [Saccharolobus solfataricus P2]|uniref:Uncharacterized protein n=1 Tax=Saccharolobus solfataricus (strain ATCC 35092 / DSM 1617 / JCM 11322 / P2) TaxID=273057 RepID=Q97U38_SACS2|nr:Hypothetical protein SSO12142 [Saccharolobus solfataricus P2]